MSDDTSTVIINGRDIPKALVAPKCESLYKSIRKKEIPANATGDQKNTNLVSFLQCQSKALKKCTAESKEYSLCHKSFMGMGSYNGRRNCGLELTSLYKCVVQDE